MRWIQAVFVVVVVAIFTVPAVPQAIPEGEAVQWSFPGTPMGGSGSKCPGTCLPGNPCMPHMATALACSEECVLLCANNGGDCTNQFGWHCSATTGLVVCEWGCSFA